MKNRLFVMCMTVSLCLAATGLRADVPYQFSYQGYLTDSVGNPVTGDWTFTFGLYEQDEGGQSLWQDTVDVETNLGLFTAVLGAGTSNALDPQWFASGQVWLELVLETELGPVILSPRQQVVSNPFAFHAAYALACDEAQDAATLGGAAPDTYVTFGQVPDVCVVPDALEGLLAELGFQPGAGYSDEDVAGYLADNGFVPCACYGQDDVAAFLLASGYVAGPHFSGLYADLVGAPDLSDFMTQDELLTYLAVSGAVLMSDGSVELQGDLDFAGQQALNMAIHGAQNAPPDAGEGQLWWDTAQKVLKVYNGQVWSAIGGGTAADLACDGCVSADDVSFGYAGSDGKGGAALSALDVSCVDCVSADEVSFAWAKGVLPGGDAEHALTADSATSALTAQNASNVTCAGCVQVADIDPAAFDAKFMAFNDTQAKLGAANVQGALDKVAQKLGSGPTDFQEGNGTIVPYVEQWGLPAYGEATTYVHLMNPANPKVMMYLYAGESSGFATSNNLVVAYDFAPNKYSGSVNGVAGQSVVQVGDPSIFTVGTTILLHQTVGTDGNGTGAGTWEIAQVLGVEGSTVLLAKPLDHTYKSCGDNCGWAQAVVAASYNQLEVVNGGVIRPSITNPFAQGDAKGGILFVRARKIVVKTGGKIHADGMTAYREGNDWSGYDGERASSECYRFESQYGQAKNCSGGGGGYHTSSSWSSTGGGGGGGNKTAGANGASNGGQGGGTKGDAGGGTLHFGGSGGSGYASYAGRGGGMVVLGAETIIVENGGSISANAAAPSCCCGNNSTYSGAGGGAGGTVLLFTEELLKDGTVEATGSAGNECGGGRKGGDGGEGWLVETPPIAGSVNESYAKGVQIHVDGENITAEVGDPNAHGFPHWDAQQGKWGGDGLTGWNTGQLDLTSVVSWTLGEHKLLIKETGGAGGDIKMFLYVIYPFSKAAAPANDTCDAPQFLDLTGPAIVTGTTEDVMGKIKATDANLGPFCGGSGGPDLVYAFTLEDWRQLSIDVLAAFTPRTYIRAAACADGEMMGCGEAQWTSNVLSPGTYYLFVDADGNMQKGDFTLKVTPAPPGPPTNDTCAAPKNMVFEGGKAVTNDMSLFANNNSSAACGGTQGPDMVYKFDVPAGTTKLNVQVDADFNPVIYIAKGDCSAAPIACTPTSSYDMGWPTPGTYFLFVDGVAAQDKGLFTATLTLTTN